MDNQYDMNCYFCNSQATEIMVDHDNRHQVKCSGAICGNYELAIVAKNNIGDNRHMIPEMMKHSMLAKEQSKFAQFTTGSNRTIKIEDEYIFLS